MSPLHPQQLRRGVGHRNPARHGQGQRMGRTDDVGPRAALRVHSRPRRGQGRDGQALHAPCVRRAPRQACRRPNGHAWFFGRHQGRRLPPCQLGDLSGQTKPDRHQPRTRTHGDVLRRSRWPPRQRRRQHAPLLRVVGTRHRKPRDPNDHPGSDHFFQLWHSEVGGLQPGIAVHGRGEEPFV